MKYKSAKYTLVLSALISVTLFSCLKDTAYNNQDIQPIESHNNGDQNVVSIALTATTTDNHLQLSFNQSDVDTSFDAIPVVLAGTPAKEDITVTLSLDPALLGSYNDANGTTHEEVPLSVITIMNPGDSATGYVVTIPKGSNTGYLQIKIKPNDFLGFDYALGVKITSISPSGYLIAGNLSTGILAIGVKNQYDGIYSYKGYTLRAGDNTLTGYFSGAEMPLITAGATSVKFGSFALWGDGVSGIAIGFPILFINSDNSITISSSGGASNAPGYNSHYDPPTRTFYVGYTWGAGPSSRLSTDTLTYLRPR